MAKFQLLYEELGRSQVRIPVPAKLFQRVEVQIALAIYCLGNVFRLKCHTDSSHIGQMYCDGREHLILLARLVEMPLRQPSLANELVNEL